MTQDANTLFQGVVQNSGTIVSVADLIMMFLSAIMGLLATVVTFIIAVVRVGYSAVKIDGEFNTKQLFIISIVPIVYMLFAGIFYQIATVIIHAVYAHATNINIDLFTYQSSNYNFSHIASSTFIAQLGKILNNAVTITKNSILTLTVGVYIMIMVFYFSVALDAILSKTKLSVIFNVIVFFTVAMIGVIVAHTYDNLTSATLFKNGITMHNVTSHRISEFLHNELIYYTKYYFSHLS